MALIEDNFALSFHGGGGRCKRWMYTTTDTADVVQASGYFNLVQNHLNVGDIIDAITVDAVAPKDRTTASMITILVSAIT